MKQYRGVGVALGALLCAGTAQADTLREAFVRVYQSNPTLTGVRASQRANDENVPIARAPGLPDLAATGSYNEFLKQSSNNFTAPARSVGGSVTLGLPLYAGGQIRNSVKAADSRVEAGRADLRGFESGIFTETVAAYMDVIRDAAIVELNGGNVRVLETNLQASKDRFEVGDLTRTDVAQSDARLALARAQLQQAEAQLEASHQNYVRIVGKFPEGLEPPPPLPSFPASADDAVDVAVANNPQIEAANKRSRAADFDIGVARSLKLPRLSAFATGDYVNFLGTLGGGLNTGGVGFTQSQNTATAGLRATLPLFQGGEPAARVRQAQANKSRALEDITLIERQVIADARTAYSRYQAALAVIDSAQTAVSANELALEGTRAEQGVGTRNVLDVLNAEQELLNSRVTLVTARRDAYVLGFALLAAMGRAEARDLGLEGGTLYDPTINYRRVRNRINDFDEDPKPVPVATRTVTVDADAPLAPAYPLVTSPK